MKNKFVIILPLMLGTFMAALDNSIVNVSLPVMQKQFGVQVNEIQWVITAYMLAFCVFMPLTNWVKNRIGLFKMYIISIIVFVTGSILCGLSSSLVMLTASRVLQALGGGALTPIALALLSSVFSENERGKIMGWWGLGVVVGPALGPTLGGLLTQYLGWPYIFFVNIPFGLLAIALSFKYLQSIKEDDKNKVPFDSWGFILFTLFIVLLQFSIARIAKSGIGAPEVIASFVISIIALYLFIKNEKNRQHALLDLSVFKSKDFVTSIAVTVIRSVALFGAVFLLPFLLQGLMGYSELQTGLLLLPASAAIAIMMPVAGKWSDNHGPKAISIAGLLLIAISMYQFSLLGKNSSVFSIIFPMVVRGIGLGFLFSPLSAAVLNSLPSQKSATASSYYSLFMQIGGSVGISILAVIHHYLSNYYHHHGKTVQAAEHDALKGCFLFSMVIALVALWPAFKLPPKAAHSQKAEVALN